ncbi:MAG: hypothetical protein WAK97_11325, partial [Pseudolabrys sp.]
GAGSVTIKLRKRAVALLAAQPRGGSLKEGTIPRKTDIAELALIKVGKRAQGSSTFPPSFE